MHVSYKTHDYWTQNSQKYDPRTHVSYTTHDGYNGHPTHVKHVSDNIYAFLMGIGCVCPLAMNWLGSILCEVDLQKQ